MKFKFTSANGAAAFDWTMKATQASFKSRNLRQSECQRFLGRFALARVEAFGEIGPLIGIEINDDRSLLLSF
jgi:hypothetical protein